MFFEIVGKCFADCLIDGTHHLTISEFRLGLSLKLGLGHLDTDHCRETFAEVFAGNFDLCFLNLLLRRLFCVLFEHTRHSSAETRQVRTAFDRIDVVHIRVKVLTIARVVNDGHLNRNAFLLGVDIDHIGDERIAHGILIAHELAQTAFRVEYFATRVAIFIFFALIGERDGESGVQEGQFAQTIGEDVIFIFRGGENFGVGPELLARTSQRSFADHLHRIEGMSLFIFLLVDFAIAEHLRKHVRGKRIDARNADTMQTARHFVRTFVELTAGVQHRHHHLQGAHAFFFVDVNGDTASVVLYNDRIVLANHHINVGAETGQGFVDGVIHRFINQMVQTFLADVADVHRRTLANGLQTFEYLDIRRGIARGFMLLFFHADFQYKTGSKDTSLFRIDQLMSFEHTTIDHKARNHHTEQEQSGKEDEKLHQDRGQKGVNASGVHLECPTPK